MCGIAGFTQFHKRYGNPRDLLQQMGNSIAHRGPDDSDTFTDHEVGLCHRRLAIIDLSESGRQPMTSPTGRYVTVFNGEIYNFPSLRASLEEEGVRFRGTSDTEVMLALYEKLGPACLRNRSTTTGKTVSLSSLRRSKRSLQYQMSTKLSARMQYRTFSSTSTCRNQNRFSNT